MYLVLFLLEGFLYCIGDDVNGHLVMAALGDDDIGVSLGGLDELQVHRLHGFAVVLDGGFDGTAALGDVADDDAQHAVVVIGVYEDLDVHLVPQFLAGEDEDAFHNYDIVRFYRNGLRGAGAGDVRVDGLLDGLAAFEFPDLLAHQFPVNGIRVVEVDVLALLHGHVAGIFVVGVLGDNVLFTLQQVAALHRRKLGTTVIGITGTNGKTTTKELTNAVLSSTYSVLCTQGNLNNSIGVPLTVLGLEAEHEYAIVEMGASHPGDIKELVEVSQPDFGLITNVGKAHLLGFGSFEGVKRTKGELYDWLRDHNGTAFVNRDNEHLQQMCTGLPLVEYGKPGQEGLLVEGEVLECNPFVKFRWRSGKGDR